MTRDGAVEMDASFMDGQTLDAGAVAGVRRIKNVIRLARRVGGTGGIILADQTGRVGFAFNTLRMARGYIIGGMSEVVADC